MPKWLKIILAIVAIIIGIFVLLFIAAKLVGWAVGERYTTMQLVQYIVDYLTYIWRERLFN